MRRNLTTKYSSRYNIFQGYRVGTGRNKKDFIGPKKETRARRYAEKLLMKKRQRNAEVPLIPLYKKGKYVRVSGTRPRGRRMRRR